MVTLYRELADVCHSRGRRRWVGTQLGRHTTFTVQPHFSENCAARFSNEWKTLVDEGIADALVIGDYELMRYADHPYWRTKDGIELGAGEDLYAWVAREFRSYCAGRTDVFLFSEWLPTDLGNLQDRLEFFAQKIEAHGFDGIDIHEAWSLESVPGGIEAFGRFARRVRGIPEP